VTAAGALGALRFVFDENLSPQLAQAMRLLDDSIEIHHITELPGLKPGTGDVEFLPRLGEEGRLLITRDTRQRKRPAELDAWKRNGVGSFVLGGKNQEAWDLVKQLVLAWPQIKEAGLKTRRPFGYRVRPNGGKLEPLTL
jgi:hypothetical protein